MGYHRAGFEVVGVDIKPQPHYPFRFIQGDALGVLADLIDGWAIGEMTATFPLLRDFDAIHASPPCQRYSVLAKRNGNGATWPDLIPRTRDLLRRAELPYVLENVQGAPLLRPIVLCGASFRGLRVIRHRLFETNTTAAGRAHVRHPLVYTMDKRKTHYGQLDEWKAFVSVNGGGNCSVAAARDAMGIDWMTKAELNEAIPPAYAEFIGRQIREFVHG